MNIQIKKNNDIKVEISGISEIDGAVFEAQGKKKTLGDGIEQKNGAFFIKNDLTGTSPFKLTLTINGIELQPITGTVEVIE